MSLSITRHEQLSFAQLHQLEQLLADCQLHDGYGLKLLWVMLQERQIKLPLDWLAYWNDQIVGYMGVFSYQHRPLQVYLLVDPAFRRRGTAKTLLTHLTSVLAHYKLKSYELLVPTAAHTLIAKLIQLGAQPGLSCHELVCQAVSPVTAQPELRLHRASLMDVADLASIHASGFKRQVEPLHRFYQELLAQQQGVCWLGRTVEGQAIGMAQTHRIDKQGYYITNFTLLPDYRGKGYGRALLTGLLGKLQLHSQQPARLEVAADDTALLNFYQSSGFRIDNSYQYYAYQPQAPAMSYLWCFP